MKDYKKIELVLSEKEYDELRDALSSMVETTINDADDAYDDEDAETTVLGYFASANLLNVHAKLVAAWALSLWLGGDE